MVAVTLGAVHPEAAGYPADFPGLSSLYALAGDIYAGYGDYGLATNAHIESVPVADPTAAWTDHLAFANMPQIGVYRLLESGRIVTPDLADGAVEVNDLGYGERTPAGAWQEQSTALGPAEHVFDMIEFDGSLWACGSDNTGAFGGAGVWRSTDDGATWTLSLVGPRAPDASGNQRFYCLVIAAGVMRVMEPLTGSIFKWTGTAWASDTTSFLPGGISGGPGQPWGNSFVYPSQVPIAAQTYDLYVFDGTTPSKIASAVSGFSVGDDDALYYVASDPDPATATIYRVPPASSVPAALVTLAQTSADTYCSLCILPGSTQAVLGTSASRLALVDLS